jgi:hypothetical protein
MSIQVWYKLQGILVWHDNEPRFIREGGRGICYLIFCGTRAARSRALYSDIQLTISGALVAIKSLSKAFAALRDGTELSYALYSLLMRTIYAPVPKNSFPETRF